MNCKGNFKIQLHATSSWMLSITKNSKRKVSLPNSMLEELREYYLHKMKERDKMGERWQGGDYLFMFCHPERLRSCIKISRFSQQLTN